jgi:hypothetical protein
MCSQNGVYACELKEIGPSSEILESVITSCDVEGTLQVMSHLLPHKHEVWKFSFT